jgi:hypothetical protein
MGVPKTVQEALAQKAAFLDVIPLGAEIRSFFASK